MAQPKWMSQLERDGFVHLPGVLDADDVARLAILSLRSLDDYATSDDLVKTDEGVPVKLLYPLDKYRDFVSVLGSRPVRQIVDAILPVNDNVGRRNRAFEAPELINAFTTLERQLASP